jgi:hypothetical protein
VAVHQATKVQLPLVVAVVVAVLLRVQDLLAKAVTR